MQEKQENNKYIVRIAKLLFYWNYNNNILYIKIVQNSTK